MIFNGFKYQNTLRLVTNHAIKTIKQKATLLNGFYNQEFLS
jgi:hypothetical protein